MATKRNFRNFSEVEEEYFRSHPEEIDSYVSMLFEDYADHGQSSILLPSLQMIAKLKGVSLQAESVAFNDQSHLFSKGNPRFDNVNAIMHALGYRLVPTPIETH